MFICTGILLLGVGTGSAVSLPGHYYDGGEYEVVLLDYDVVPIDDGTEIREITGWRNLVYWKELLLDHIGRFFDKTPYGEFVGKTILPIAGSLLGFCFFFGFNRRESPEKDPDSTPAKILRYLEEHPGSRPYQIAAGIKKSRGTVAYQLLRLKREKKLTIIGEQNSIKYYPGQTDTNSLTAAVLTALEDPSLGEILNILHQHPRLTRHQIATLMGKSPDTIYGHLVNLDPRILTIEKEKNTHHYSLSPKARQICTELIHRRST